MKSIRAALVILGIAGSVVMGSSAVAGAQSAFHRQAIRGTAHGVDAVTTNALCKQWHVVGHGTLNVHGNKDPYDLDACSYQVTNRDGSIAYHLSGDYTLREGSDVLAGHPHGQRNRNLRLHERHHDYRQRQGERTHHSRVVAINAPTSSAVSHRSCTLAAFV
jgi:hypothetical protein